MTLKTGDDVLVLQSAGGAGFSFVAGKIERVDAGNNAILQDMVNGGTARVMNAGKMRYRATLVQTGTTAPVATVLENSLSGTVVWTRTSAGIYVGTLAAAFTSGKTTLFTTDLMGIADVAVTANTITLTTQGDAVLNGHTLYVEVLP